jgi:signal transduction histidine kinase/DNA-binding response OmpR family regulator
LKKLSSQNFLYVSAFLPVFLLFAISLMINAHDQGRDRERHVAENARMAAANLDIQFAQLLELTSFCATAPELIERVDLEQVERSCGRFASRISAWVVIVELGEVHRQIVNTRIAAPTVLPTYTRENERKELIALEMRSRASGSPQVADVFSGIILTEGIVSAGQFLQLADGREAMLYVGVSAASLSEQLSSLATEGGPIFGLIDPSHRIVARSAGIEHVMFADAPDWINEPMNRGASGASLGMPGPDAIGGTWDVGYTPLQNASGWIVIALQPEPSTTSVWAPLSVPSALTLIGFLSTVVLLWGISLRENGLRREALAQKATDLAIRQNQEKSRLLASLAHDIRSPLISLIGSLEMITEANEASTKKVQLARNSAEALLQLADDILELSFLGSGKMTFHPSPVDLGQLTKSLCNQLQHLADRKGLVVRLEVEPDLPSVVEVDRLRLQQVLTNLLTNAIKYTDKGEVILQICVEDMKSDHVTLDIAIVDTGVGLAPEEIPQIMREFGRLERQSDLKETGTGLGLAIVQRLLNAMGSTLRVESVQNQGSRFHFLLTLPVLPAQAELNESQTLTDCLILYAEDEPVIRELTSQRLKDAGAHVLTAGDGEEALRLLSDVTPDLLLIDLQMPGLDGVGLIRRLRETTPEVGYLIFVLTSHISGPQAADARAAGADAVFTKPIQVSALSAAMRARHGNNGKSTPAQRGKWDIAEKTVLDIEVVEDISAFKDRNRASALISEFEEAIKTDIAALTIAINTQDARQTAKIAHRSQGLCLVIGAKHVADLLNRVEVTAAGPTGTTMLASLVSELDTALALTVQELRKKFV